MTTNQQRKEEHLTISLNEEVGYRSPSTGFMRYRLIHQALPEMALGQADPGMTLWGKTMNAPLVISAMTGGTPRAAAINRHLATAAQALRVALGVGSQRPAIDDSRLAPTYQVRDVAPDVLLLANLGAVQLNYGYGVDACRRAVDMIEADALTLHLNPLQECLQAGGNTDFSGLISKIESVCRHLEPLPVVVKECGWGISGEVARMLAQAGVAAIDVAGAGGTSWSRIEGARANSPSIKDIAADFSTWGIPTADSLLMTKRAAPGVIVTASGGIRSGVDVAKALALGADLCGIANPLLRPATVSAEAVIDHLSLVLQELRIAMFCVGAKDLSGLRSARIVEVD